MTIEQVKKHLETAEAVNFQLPTGAFVPEHFHVTEVGLVTKHFIDCGGTERLERVANFQLWNANDTEHRLKPKKLLDIIALSQQKLGIGDLEIEVEYQSETIGKYNLGFSNDNFVLIAKQTDCLAKENCGIPTIPTEKVKINLLNLATQTACCTPGGGCC